MPIYEYVCDDCNYGFERIQAFSDDPIAVCPQCGGSVRRVISSVGIIFKGSGWYITDSKRQLSASPSKPGAAAKEAAPAKDEGAKAAPAKDAGAGKPAKGD